MTDVWEDDEFGGFESADLDSFPVESSQTEEPSSSTVAATKQTSPGGVGSSKDGILSWIMANSPKIQPTSPDEENADVQIGSLSVLNSIVVKDESTTTSEVGTISMKSKAGGWYEADTDTVKQESSPGNPFTMSSDSSEAVPTTFDDLFANFSRKSSDEFANDQNEPKPRADSNGQAEMAESLKQDNSVKITQSAQMLESITAVKAAAALEIEKEKSVNEHALQELQARLDAAIVVKEQTLKSFENLQEELKELNAKAKADLDERRLKHEKAMVEVRNQHREEIKILQKTSEETIRTISQHYKELWKAFEEDQQITQDTSANRIVEKCVEIMQQQHTALTQELECSRMKQEEELKHVLGEERKKMDMEISRRVSEEKEKIQKEMNDYLKEELSKEVKRLEEIHTATLKEAMSAEHTRFDELLKLTLQCERDKFTNAIQESVSNAQVEAEKSFAERRELENRHSKKHTTAMKIFLTSALEQIDNLLPCDEEKESVS